MENIDQLVDKLDKNTSLVLYCDYDGTLTPIVEKPKDAILNQDQRNSLQELSNIKNIRLVLISGRDIKTLKKLSKLGNIDFIGSHGHEISIKNESGTKTFGGTNWKKSGKLLLDKLKPVLKKYLEINIEEKPSSTAIHYRQVPNEEHEKVSKKIMRLLQDLAISNKLSVIHGKAVIEIKPKGVDKGLGIKKFRNLTNTKDAQEIYIGDDTTDEDGMKVVKNNNVWVGDTPNPVADFHIQNTNEVYTLLEKIKNKFSLKL